MGFVLRSCCSTHSPISPFSLYPSSSSKCYHPSQFCFSSQRIPFTTRRNIKITMASQENPFQSNSCVRRVILFMGFAVIPLITMWVNAIEGLGAEDTEYTELEARNEKQKAEGSSSEKSFFSLINALGICGSGILAVLYGSTNKRKEASDATIESMKTELEEKEAVIAFLEKRIKTELVKEKETCNKAIEEQLSLGNQLELANYTISRLEQEQQKEKRLVEELAAQVEYLETSLCEATTEKTKLEDKLDSEVLLHEQISLFSSEIKEKDIILYNLDSELGEKERAFTELGSAFEDSKNQLCSVKSEMKEWKDRLLKNEKEMEAKSEMVEKLNAKLNFAVAEKDQIMKKLDAVREEYDHFKFIKEEKFALDAKQTEEQEKIMHQLEEKLRFSVNEVKKKNGLICDLSKEKENLKDMLNTNLKNVKNLEQDLHIARDSLEKSKDKVSGLEKQLHHSRLICSDLETEASKLQAEFSGARELLEMNLDQSQKRVKVLAGELMTANELLDKLNRELQPMSQELAASVQKSNSLEAELVDSQEKAETAAVDLEKERENILSLKEELMAVKTEIFKEKEARKSLEVNLEEATNALNEMNRNALMFSKELELAALQISTLDYEKDAFHRAIDEHKQASQEARENLEDAQSMVMRLGKERVSLGVRTKKLEEEMSSAKGELLRLRCRMNSLKPPVHGKRQEKSDMERKADHSTRKATRARKKPYQEDS